MVRRFSVFLVLAIAISMLLAGCTNKRVSNPIADVDSKQPDKVLFDRAMDMLKHNKFDQARLTLQTLINTYPDSEYIARAKLGVADSWFAEGGSAALAQAEAEYKDFKTFFPDMPEAAEAQLKVANIHYQQMEKPDRDFTHARRAEDEYRTLILEFPDSPLVPKAKERLREVQEVLAEREFRIGRFYYLRQSYAAAIARLKSVADAYPLYSQAEEALYMIGDAYEQQIELIRASGLPETRKGQFIKEYADRAQDAYSRIITRYPVTGRAADAKARLQALNRPVPAPTAEAIAQNKAEEESRSALGMWGKAMLNFRKRPDMAQASKVGEPTLQDPQPTNAPELIKRVNEMMRTGGTQNVTVQQGGEAKPGDNQPVPRSDDQSRGGNGDGQQEQTTPQTAGTPEGETPAEPAPAQVNEISNGTGQVEQTAATSDQSQNKDESSSKKKRKKGVRKLIPF